MATAILIFVACTLLNVVLATIKSVMTIKGSKASAAVWNALSFGLYAYIVILTANAPITTFWKVFITAACNLVGVYVVKLVEERMRKEKLWLIKTTIPHNNFHQAKEALEQYNIPFTYYDVKKYYVIDTFCNTRQQSDTVLNISKLNNGKVFIIENRLEL